MEKARKKWEILDKKKESGSHDPNAPKEAGEARDQYFMEKARKKWEILDKKKEI